MTASQREPFIYIAPEDVPRPIALHGSWGLPATIASEDAFAVEALRFAGWLATRRSEFNASSWRGISDMELAAAIHSTHRLMHDKVLDWLAAVRRELGSASSAECSGVEVLSRALGMARTTPGPPAAPKAEAANVAGKKKLGKVAKPFGFANAWENLDRLSLHCDWAAIEAAMKQTFGEDAIRPGPGGEFVIARPGYRSAGPDPWAARGDLDITLSEKIFREARALGATSAGVTPTLPTFAPTRESVAAVRAIGDMLTWAHTPLEGLGPWSAWFAQLDHLDAVMRPLYSANSGRPFELLDAALDVGIPWSGALTAKVRQLLCDALRTVFVLSLPIHALHEVVDGLVAVGLIEARLQRPEYLTKAACESLKWLSAERTTIAVGRWSSLPASKGVLDDLQERPVWSFAGHVTKALKRERITGLADAKESVRVGLLQEQDSWPSFGAIQLVDLLKTSGHRFHFGATAFASLHLIVAARRLLDAREDAEIAFPRDDPRVEPVAEGPRCGGRIALLGPPEKPVKVEFVVAPASVRLKRNRPGDDRPALLGIGAGSLFRGGRHPPHKTHSLGDSFDLSLPRQTEAWVPFRLKDRVPDDEAASLYAEFGDIWRVITAKEERDRPKPLKLASSKRLKQSILDELAKLTRVLPPDDDGAVDLAALKATADSAASAFGGLPDFEAADRRAMVAGHVALLLSFPRQVLFSSPLVHLHALRVIAEVAFAKDALDRDARGVVRQLFGRSVFAFFPTDHHNHWHVVYSPWLRAPKPAIDEARGPAKKVSKSVAGRQNLERRGPVVTADKGRLMHLEMVAHAWALLGIDPIGILGLYLDSRARIDDRSAKASAQEDQDIQKAIAAAPPVRERADGDRPPLYGQMFHRVAHHPALGTPRDKAPGAILLQALKEDRLAKIASDVEEDDEARPIDLDPPYDARRGPLP